MDSIMAVSEASRSVEKILGILGSAAFMEIDLDNGVGVKLNRLEKSLFAIESVLQDAGEQQSSNPSIRNWLHSLIDVACDIEDILDRISTEELEGRVKGSTSDRELRNVCFIFHRVFDEMRQFGFKQRSSGKVALSDGCNKRVTHSSVVESEVFGRDEDIESVVKCLLTWSYDDDHPRVLPIIANRGMGRSTLVKLVMSYAKVARVFEVRIWVYISRDFTLETAVLCVLQSATGQNYSGLEMGAVLVKLREVLVGKTCLIVLDGTWIEDPLNWSQLKDLLAVGGRGSTIIVTTDNPYVSFETGTIKPYELKELSDMDSWSMFKIYAFNVGEVKAHPLLVEIGKSIIKKCKGVPLAVKVLGCLLRNERDPSYWRSVEKSELWEFNQHRGILPALAVSFCHTQHLLKLCLASCAIFGKRYPLYRSDLISLWMAHGILQCGDGSTEDALDLGDRCFDELISRSFFQVPDYSITKKHAMIHMGYQEDKISQEFRNCDGKVICVEMHDLLHDLVSYAAREETVVVSGETFYLSPRTRHLVWDRKWHQAEDFPMHLLIAKKARTFAFLYPMENISRSFLDTLFSNFRCLRILIFSNCALEELPESIGNLKHLRYLDLRGNSLLKLLPEWLCDVVNLNVLDLGECRCLETLPENIHRLISLRTLTLTFRSRYLDERALRGWNSLQVLKLTFCPNLESLSEEFGNLKSLIILIIRECNSLVDLPNSIGSLKNLEHITLESCRELDLTGWEGLRDLVSLRILVINFLPGLLEIPDMGKAAETLQYLKVSNCESFYSFPESLQNCTSLLKLQVFSCPSLTSLPSGIQGLLTLQELRISGCPELIRKCERDIGDYWHLIAHIPEVYTDECYAPTTQAQAGPLPPICSSAPHDLVIESCFDTNVDGGIATFKETTLKSGVSGGDFLSYQTDLLNEPSFWELPLQAQPSTFHYPADYISPPGDFEYKEMASMSDMYGGDYFSIQTEDLNAHKSFDVSAFQAQADTSPYPATESCFDSNVDDSIAAFKETTLKSDASGGDSLSNQTERQSPISPAMMPGSSFSSTYNNNNNINKKEAKGLLFLFGEGYEFEKQMLIQLWMALGLLALEPMEEIGAYFFENLVSQKYILCSVPNSLYRVNMKKLGIEDRSYIKLDSTRRNNNSSAETLHASVVCDEINDSVFQTLRCFSKLRTLLFLGSYGSRLQQVPRDLFLCYEFLEALDLSGTHIKELPSSAGKMINLRYLDLSWTFLEALPERIDCFKKLQTLKLEGCSRLRKLPNETKGLTDLRHLHLDVLRGLAGFPRGMGALVNIRTLSAFPVGTEQGLEISELKHLNHITGSFCIANIENVKSAYVAKEAFLNEKKNIKKLKLRWSNRKIEHPTNEAECILQNLCPFLNLEEIEVVRYPGIKLPDWIADVSFDKLVNITLLGCANISMLPSMGNLPALATLELISLNNLTKMDFKGVAAECVAFPKLQKLSVDEMLNLETWEEAGEEDYPCIKELSIKDCPKLRQFPSVAYVPSLKHLEVSGCESLVFESDKTLPQLEQLIVEDCPLMEDRCYKDRGQDWHKIQHVPTIWINHVPIQLIENAKKRKRE